MYALTHLIYNKILAIVDKYHCESLIISDEFFHGENGKDSILEDNPYIEEPQWFYTKIFNEIKATEKSLIEVCDSTDLNESDRCGDFVYYIGYLTSEVPFLYEDPTHPWWFPSRVIFYDPKWQIEIDSEKQRITISPVVETNRVRFFAKTNGLKRFKVKEMLSQSDRPALV